MDQDVLDPDAISITGAFTDVAFFSTVEVGPILPEVFKPHEQPLLQREFVRPGAAAILLRFFLTQNLQHLFEGRPFYPGESPKLLVAQVVVGLHTPILPDGMDGYARGLLFRQRTEFDSPQG